MVTHDPLEALALADRLVVLERGRVVQTGGVFEVTAQPRSPYVADLVGVNLLRGRVDGGRVALAGGGELSIAAADAGDVFAVIHPRAVALYDAPPHGTPRNLWRGVVRQVDPEGERMRVRLDGPPAVVAEITAVAAAELGVPALRRRSSSPAGARTLVGGPPIGHDRAEDSSHVIAAVASPRRRVPAVRSSRG